MENYKEVSYLLKGKIGKVKVEKSIDDKTEIRKICLEDYFTKLANEIILINTEIKNSKTHYNDLIFQIIEKAIEVTNTTKADAFVNYSGHVNCFSIDIHTFGWSTNHLADYSKSIYLNKVTEKEKNKKLIEILEKLDNLLLNDLLKEENYNYEYDSKK